jgi:ATP-dependent Clp endopeptidase proteolytic subunit ClpP
MTQFSALLAGTTAFSAAAAGPASGEIVLYNEIGGSGTTATAFRDALQKLASARQIELRINSPGGDVFEGVAIYNMLKRHPATVTVTVDGLAASIASLIAMAGDTVKIPANAMMFVHSPFAAARGTAADMRDLAGALDKIRDSMIASYQAKTNLDREKLVALLDAESWLNANDAKSLGFADEILPAVKVTARFDLSRFPQPAARSGWDAAFDEVHARLALPDTTTAWWRTRNAAPPAASSPRG